MDVPMAKENRLVAFLLAAGRGERLRPLTLSTPKPLLPVCGIPMYRFAHSLAKEGGAASCVMNISYMREAFDESLRRYQNVSLPILLSLEEGGPYGTAGGIFHAKPLLEEADEILILNCDTIVQCDMEAFAAFHRSHGDPATILLKRMTNVEDFTTILVDQEGWVTGIARPEEQKSDLIFCGVHIWRKELLERLPTKLQTDLFQDFYLTTLIKERKLLAFVTDGFFADLGTLERYRKASALLQNLLARSATPPWLANLLNELS